ncbi:MAG TPA: hypothetical protein VME63_06465 [Dyella sp.]|uniref:hypothetical protein n=1 Tax=Dyella sp. TaxID=1869338 RepID=UPI002C820EDA|nr:hypothetical protein [Dyella sp.]HTV85027.1 hypothetical protein [Dyella sp.]
MRDLVVKGDGHLAARWEIANHLAHKGNKASASKPGAAKTTLRVEMVGACVYLPKKLLKTGVMNADHEHDVIAP